MRSTKASKRFVHASKIAKKTTAEDHQRTTVFAPTTREIACPGPPPRLDQLALHSERQFSKRVELRFGAVVPNH